MVEWTGQIAHSSILKFAADSESFTTITAWMDTAFTGELVLPRSAIELLELPQSSAILAGLADGKQVVLGTYSCVIRWFDNELHVDAVESDGKLALLGIGLLRGRRLEIDYRERTLNIW